MPWLRMRDFLTVKATEVFDMRAKDSSSGSSLLLKVGATHAGIINGNHRLYRPDRMQDSVHTWVPKHGYPRPLLIGHDEKGTVLGRVKTARYVDESYKWSQDFPIIKDSIFYDKKMGLHETVDWIVKNLMDQEEYTGLGYIELGLNVTNPDAIEKVIRDEYLTVSVGFKTDSAICSVCHQDWAVDDRCEHKLGETVEGKPVFLISGNFDYEEVSFVNFPADPFAGTISKEKLADAAARCFFLGLGRNPQRTVVALSMTDSLYTSDIIHAEDTVVIDLSKIELRNSFEAEIVGEALTAERAQEMKKNLQDWQPETDELKTKKRSLVSTLNAKIRKNGWDKKIEPVADATAEAEIQAALKNDECAATSACTTEGDCECENWDDYQFTDEEKAYFEDEDGLYAEIEVELDAAVTAGELKDEEVRDAKLSTEQRKKLSNGTFCGPGRSFPVPDCAHVTAARRLIGRAKVSESTKSKILSCVSRKASSLGCGGKDCQLPPKWEDDFKGMVTASFGDAVDLEAGSAPAEIIAHYDGLNKNYKKADADLRSKILGMHGSMLEHWHTNNVLEYYRERLKEHAKDSLVVLDKSEWSVKEDAVNALTTDKAELEKKLQTAKDTNTALLNTYKNGLAVQIVMYRLLTGVEGYKALDANGRKAKIDQLSKRHVESLKDMVTDIMSELKWNAAAISDAAAAETTREDKADEPGRTVDDNAQVTEPTESARTTDELSDAEKASRQQDLWDRLRYMTPQEQRLFFASLNYKEADKATKK